MSRLSGCLVEKFGLQGSESKHQLNHEVSYLSVFPGEVATVMVVLFDVVGWFSLVFILYEIR